ncbi:MAG: hypothetical protein U0Z44_13760 [Kouleothrix sp.]
MAQYCAGRLGQPGQLGRSLGVPGHLGRAQVRGELFGAGGPAQHHAGPRLGQRRSQRQCVEAAAQPRCMPLELCAAR